MDGVGGLGNSHLANQDHGFQANNKKISGRNDKKGRKETSRNHANSFISRPERLRKTSPKEHFDATQGTEVVEDQVSDALGDDKPPGRSRI